MENRTTPRLWIKEREKELKSLEEEIAALEGRIVETADCEEEIGFVEGLLRKRGGLGFGEKDGAYMGRRVGRFAFRIGKTGRAAP